MKTPVYKKTPPRLSHVWQKYNPPLYFVTFNTWQRQTFLANERIQHALVRYGEKNADEGRAIGRYVIMPDHVHLFVRLPSDARLSEFVRLLKQCLGRSVPREARLGSRIWQPGFFDHLMRRSESYAEKWGYVRENPVRAGLVEYADDWPYQGEIVRISGV